MSILIKCQQPTASSNTTQKNSTIICSLITPRKPQKTQPTPQRENSNQNVQYLQIHGQFATTKPSQPRNQEKTRTSNRISWLVSMRDELLLKTISEQTEFRFVVFKQAFVDNGTINKWQTTCSMYNLFDRCNFCKVYEGSLLATKTWFLP